MTTPSAAVVGWPLKHSLSPRMFRLFSREAREPVHYKALAVRPEEFDGVLKEAAGGAWIGWNVTLPHKVRAMELMDALDSTAREIGAVNVVRFADGRSEGFNTDAAGFLAPLKRKRFSIAGRRVVVLGAGGAARAVCAAVTREKAGDLRILNRTAEKARALAKAVGAAAAPWTREEILAAVGGADLVVNTTSLGMEGDTNPLPAGARFKPGALAYDLVYRPRVTPFLQEASQGGAEALGGLGMLVAQAAETWRIWFGKTLPVDALDQVEADLKEIL
ncbi:MAG: shikimate dehydrogenase [Proteobacteria bacterium]|nr:shikimate dehydrogenase [Pseudomonadota bacterium]